MHVPSGSYEPIKTKIVVNFELIKYIALCRRYDRNLRFANKEYTRMFALSNEYTQTNTQGGYIHRLSRSSQPSPAASSSLKRLLQLLLVP